MDGSTHLRLVQAQARRFARMYFDSPAVIVVREGHKIIRVGDRDYVANPGEAIAVSADGPVDVINEMAADGYYRSEVYVLGNDLVADFGRLSQSGAAFGVLPVNAAIEASLAHFRDVMAPDCALPEALRRHRLMELLIWLQAGGIVLRPAGEHRLTVQLRRLIQSDPARDWTTGIALELLAARGFAMSEATLRRRLMAEGTGFSEILVDARLSIALTRLQSTTDPITMIALDCGYASPSRFAIRFRDRFGLPPSAIRDKNVLIDRPGTEAERSGVAGIAAE